MYNKVETDMNFVGREKKIEEFWKKEDIFQKSVDTRSQGEMYMFYDGPPTANGKPHIGHVLTRAIKDMIPRYRTMKGYTVPRKLRRCWALTAKSRLKSTEWSLSSKSVRNPSGNIRECGKISPAQ